jgi:hypothetical protein
MNICSIPVSLGELYDKYSILEIKSEKINDEHKLFEIKKEINFLKPYIDKFNLSEEFKDKIKNVNLQLWNIEDNIRKKEKKNEFDNEFIQLARDVYITNDERAKIKNDINKYLNSEINEIKSYA